MSRILLVDDSPHAQRMGERILTEEGFEVVTVSNADSALVRMDDVDPDVVLADTVMPGRSGYEICHFLKMSPRHRHVRVVLTAGVLEPLDADHVKRVEADATLKKPFEASVLLATVRPLAERAAQERAQIRTELPGSPGPASLAPKAASAPNPAAVPFVVVVDAEQVHAAVTVALDAAMEKIVDEITARVLAAFESRKSAAPAQPASPAAPAPAQALAPVPEVSSTPKAAPSHYAPKPMLSTPDPRPAAETKKPADPSAPTPRMDTIRRVSPLRSRPGSILGLELNYVEPEVPAAVPRSTAPESLFSNSRPAADPDPGSRAGSSDARPTADPDPSTRPALPDKK